MSREPTELLKEILALPPEARAAIADSVLDSLDQEVEPGAYDEWSREIRRRAAELEAGTVKPIPWSDARTRLKSPLSDDQ
jgi:putative addiction module component (TIGR02574 family)